MRGTTIWFRPDLQEPTESQCERIAVHLRPGFEFYESPRARRERRDGELRQYTEQQFGALGGCRPTGGSSLKVKQERARHCWRSRPHVEAQVSAAGSRSSASTATSLGWLQKQVGTNAQAWVGTLHSLLLEVAGFVPLRLPVASSGPRTCRTPRSRKHSISLPGSTSW